jgi:hypothetical protein
MAGSTETGPLREPAPDNYLGDSEGEPAHWGGEPRKAFVIGHPTLATGAVVDLVRVDAPIPRSNGAPLDKLIVMPRYPDDRLDRLGAGPIIVNLLISIEGVDIHKAAFVEGDLRIQFWADAAATPELLPKPLDVPAFWAETLARIGRFIERFGHSRVPDRYADEVGPLDAIVGNIRLHHAGRAGGSPGPFPGIHYAADLEKLPGWEW